MPAYWIFVFTEFTDFSRGSVDELFSRLGQNPKWYIGTRTGNRTRLGKGDKVVFYQTGDQGKKFVGTANLESELRPAEKGDLFSFVLLSNISLWRRPVPLDMVARKLSFVKSKEGLHYYFQTGIRSITENDFCIFERYSSSNKLCCS